MSFGKFFFFWETWLRSVVWKILNFLKIKKKRDFGVSFENVWIFWIFIKIENGILECRLRTFWIFLKLRAGFWSVVYQISNIKNLLSVSLITNHLIMWIPRISTFPHDPLSHNCSETLSVYVLLNQQSKNIILIKYFIRNPYHCPLITWFSSFHLLSWDLISCLDMVITSFCDALFSFHQWLSLIIFFSSSRNLKSDFWRQNLEFELFPYF